MYYVEGSAGIQGHSSSTIHVVLYDKGHTDTQPVQHHTHSLCLCCPVVLPPTNWFDNTGHISKSRHQQVHHHFGSVFMWSFWVYCMDRKSQPAPWWPQHDMMTNINLSSTTLMWIQGNYFYNNKGQRDKNHRIHNVNTVRISLQTPPRFLALFSVSPQYKTIAQNTLSNKIMCLWAAACSHTEVTP